MGAANEETAKENHQAAVEIFNATGWIHKAAKLSVIPGIQTLDEFKIKFPGQLSDKDLPIGKFQKHTPENKYYSENNARKSIRFGLQKIHRDNETRSDMFRENLSSYKFIDTQVRKIVKN